MHTDVKSGEIVRDETAVVEMPTLPHATAE
jgi:hypothetical protein